MSYDARKSIFKGVTNSVVRRTALERPATEDDSSVSENCGTPVLLPEYPGIRMSWVNLPLLRGKAKYIW